MALPDAGVEEIEEVELNATGDLDGGRVGDVADAHGEFTEVAEDHAAGRADPAVVRAEAGHGLPGAQGPSDLALDQGHREWWLYVCNRIAEDPQRLFRAVTDAAGR